MPSDKILFPCYNGFDDTERPNTTFYQDFKIAERFGKSAVKNTFNRAFFEWKSDYKYLTELCVVINHLLWEHDEKGHSELTNLYMRFWEKADGFAVKNLTGESANHFFRVLD